MVKAKDVGPFGDDRLAKEAKEAMSAMSGGSFTVPPAPARMPVTMPTVGRIVQYRQKKGSLAWLPAIVTVTEDSFVAGVWVEPAKRTLDQNMNMNYNPGYGPTAVDGDGETYTPSEIPPVKKGRIHVRIFSPIARDYPEFNVFEGDDPGCWRWPPLVVTGG